MIEGQRIYRRLIRKVEPAVSMRTTISIRRGRCRHLEAALDLGEDPCTLFLPALWFQVWWLLPILFLTSIAWVWKESISGKAGNGYPGLEAGDAAGIGCMGFLSAVVSLIWFILALI